MDKKTWLIIEPTFNGHHYTYLENIIEQANFYNIHVIIATQNNIGGHCIKEKILEKFVMPPLIFHIGDMHEIKYNINFFTLFLHEIKVRNYYKMIYNQVSLEYKVNHVFIPYLDDFTYSLSLFGSPFNKTTFSGISMRQQFHLFLGNDKFSKFFLIIKKLLFINLLKSKQLTHLYIIDPKLKDYLDKYFISYAKKVKYFPDPVKKIRLTEKTIARKLLSIPVENVVVLLFGYIDERKGVKELVNWAIKNCKITTLTVLFCGCQSNEIKNYFKSNTLTDSFHIIQKDEFISEYDEGLFFSAADLVWVAYRDFNLMSSVLVKSAQAQLSIIYYDNGLISYFAKKYGSDQSINSNSKLHELSFEDNLCLTTFTESNNQFVREHNWDNAGYILFNS